MECFERGLLTKEDTGGIELKFGNAEAMIECVELIARNKGFGAFLAQGSARMAKEIGQGSEAFAINVKGLEMPMHEPRISKGLGLGYMINPIGSDHMMNMVDIIMSGLGSSGMTSLPDAIPLGVPPAPYDSIGPAKVRLLHTAICKRMLHDSMVICNFMPYSFQQMTKIIRDVAGWDTTEAELLRIAERNLTAMRLYNVRCGLTSEDDKLPARFFEPRIGGEHRNKLDSEEMSQARQYYYSILGWDSNGVPDQRRLEDLSIQ